VSHTKKEEKYLYIAKERGRENSILVVREKKRKQHEGEKKEEKCWFYRRKAEGRF